jgi:hypothetical protein
VKWVVVVSALQTPTKHILSNIDDKLNQLIIKKQTKKRNVYKIALILKQLVYRDFIITGNTLAAESHDFS